MDKPTLEQVKAEPAGKCLDLWVAEYVMGWNRLDEKNWEMPNGKFRQNYTSLYQDAFIPSQDIAAAWEVVEKMTKDGFEFSLYSHVWEAYFQQTSDDDSRKGYWDEESLDIEYVPLVICKAALLAVL